MMGHDSSTEKVPLPERVPTLTEVIDAYGFGVSRWTSEPTAWHAAAPPSSQAAAVDVGTAASSGAASKTASGETDLLAETLHAALARIDTADDARLRAALEPLITRFTDGLVAAVRAELAFSLRELSSSQPAATPPTSDAHSPNVASSA